MMNMLLNVKFTWPQNKALSGSTRSRPSYDLLSVYQWVTGFSRIIQDQNIVELKNKMLEFLAEMMEDAQDLSWASVKAAHAVILCRMEDGKLTWDDTETIDKLRWAHGQKNVVGQNSNLAMNNQKIMKGKDNGLICKFYQICSCNHCQDPVSAGRKYKHRGV